MAHQPCPLCDGVIWRPLADIRPDRSVRTDGAIVAAPLSKFHCDRCGLAVRLGAQDDPAVLYADDYQLYSNRPKADQFDPARYENLTQMLVDFWAMPEPPRRILEVGCGDGGLLRSLALRWPGAEALGIEPSASAVGFAKSLGAPVMQGMIGEALPPQIATGGFDLIYSVHVVEHTPDPSTFLREVGQLLAPGGRMIVTCPDGATPHAELIHPDHLFSMTRAHLAAFARRGGLDVAFQGDCPSGASAEFSQSIICRRATTTPWSLLPQDAGAPALFAARQAYLGLWRDLEADLTRSLRPGVPLYCFGAGGWAANIAAYCPHLWAKVEACAIDGGAEQGAQGKAVVDYAALAHTPRQFLAAVNPALQAFIAERLKRDGHTVLAWPEGLTA